MAKKKKRKNGVRNVLLVLIAIMIAAIAVMVYLCIRLVSAPQQPQTSVPTETIPFATVPATEAPTVPPTTAPPEPEHVVSNGSFHEIQSAMPRTAGVSGNVPVGKGYKKCG